MKDIVFLLDGIRDENCIKDNILDTFGNLDILCTVKSLWGSYSVKNHSNFNSKSLIHLLDNLFEQYGTCSIIRIRTGNQPIPTDLLKNFYHYYITNNLIYSRVDTRCINIKGIIIEIISRECFDKLKVNNEPFTISDGGLNAYILDNTQPFWMREKEINFYLVDNYNQFFSLPSTISIEVTSQCNLSCRKCQYHSSVQNNSANVENHNFMDINTFKRIVDEISERIPGIGISPTIRGECLLHPDIVEMTRYASHKGCRISFFTNGQLLDKNKAKALIDAGLAGINFSFDTMEDAKFNELHKGGSYRKLLNNIDDILNIRGKGNYPVIGTNLVKSGDNSAEIDKYLEYWLQRMDSVSISTELDFSRNYVHKEKFEDIQYRPPCTWLWLNMYIHSNGEIASCGLDVKGDRGIGNISESSIPDIWNGTRMNAIRNDQIIRKLKFCGADLSWSGYWNYTKIENGMEITTCPFSKTYQKAAETVSSTIGLNDYALKVREAILKSRLINPRLVNTLEKLYRNYLN